VLIRLASQGYPQFAFGATGTVTTHVSDDFFRQRQSIVIQSNGFIVVGAGQVIVRYKPDGTLDPTFNGDGILNTGLYLNWPSFSLGVVYIVGVLSLQFNINQK